MVRRLGVVRSEKKSSSSPDVEDLIKDVTEKVRCFIGWSHVGNGCVFGVGILCVHVGCVGMIILVNDVCMYLRLCGAVG